MPREKATTLWKNTLAKTQRAHEREREAALLAAASGRAEKLQRSQEMAAARQQRAARPTASGATLSQPTALAAMLASLDELSSSSSSAAPKAARKPAAVPAPLRAVLEVHNAYASGDPLAGLRRHIGTL
jgi:hypothetical protein